MQIPARFLILATVLGLNVAFAQNTTTVPIPPASQWIPATEILTPPEPATPRINGPKVFGVRPGSPFLYTIPVSGQRPVAYSADNLPEGLTLNADNGRISGELTHAGSYDVLLHATNPAGTCERKFRIVCGDTIALTPPMGWSSWNCYLGHIDQKKITAIAQAMADTGLINYGFSYINIDDAWQGRRGGPFNAIQPDPVTFPDIAAMVKQIHSLGLKAGIYSTPWVTSYDGRIGGSSESADGAWDHAAMSKGPKNKKMLPFAIGNYTFYQQDAKQWAVWGFDYLKYDWNPNEKPETLAMADALKATGRDIIYSLSNGTPFKNLPDFHEAVNLWRISGDITDQWKSLIGNGMHKDNWAPFNQPGHYNDPDMMVIGTLSQGTGKLHPTRLTADEQFTHVSLWCLLGAPLILGNDLTQLDPFTKSLVTNTEVLDIDQDVLCKQATIVAEDKQAGTLVYAKPLEDGTWAVGLFNLGEVEGTVSVDWKALGQLSGKQTVRDLWRQKNLGVFDDRFSVRVHPHGVALVKIF